jgi:hypothetical protein
MTKLIATFTSAALALALGGFAYAAEEAGGQDPAAQQSQGDTAQREQAYQAALKKCEPLAGADKEKCIDAAKRKHGQM